MPGEDDDEPRMLEAFDDGVTVVYETRVDDGARGGGGGGGGGEPATDTSGTEAVAPETPPSPDGSGPPRSAVAVPWVGAPRITYNNLTNESTSWAGISNPANTGRAALALAAISAGGEVLYSITLEPGESVSSFKGPAGTVRIAVGNLEKSEPIDGELTYDTPLS